MAGTFFPTVDHSAVQENLHLLDVQNPIRICGYALYIKYRCAACPFGSRMSECPLYFASNPHLPLFVRQLRLTHPELFI